MSRLQGPGDRRAAQQEVMIGRVLQKGRYSIEAVLGHGGMGQVFLASRGREDEPVALKQVRADEPLPPDVIEELAQRLHGKASPLQSSPGDFPLSGGANTDRFLREALLLARLNHPAIPVLYDYFLEDGYWYLVMEYIPGSTLSAYMRARAPLPPLEAVNYALQLCDVLDYLHGQSPPVVFRDLKPANSIMHPDGRLLIVDFGIARYFKEGQFSDTTDFGSPGYASPEQYEGVGQTDPRSDLFSLGVILHEMLSGQRPTRRGSVADGLEPLTKLNLAVSPALSGLVMVATRAEPMYRFQSARTFYQALERVRAVEERRAYRYHTLMAEVTAAQKTPLFPMLIPPPSSQGFLSSEVAREQDLRAQQIRMREQPQRALPRVGLEQEALAHQFSTLDESLKLRAVASPLSQSARRPVVLPPLPALPAVQPQGGTAKETPAMSALAPARAAAPTPLSPLLAPLLQSVPQKPSKKRILFSLCLLIILIVGSLLAYYYLTTHAVSYGATFSKRPTLTVPGEPIATWQSLPALPTVGSDAWQSLPSLPTEAADNTALYLESQGQAFIYMTGGFRGAQAVPTYSQGLYRYALATGQWEKVALTVFPGMGNNAAAVDEQGDLLFTGGYAPTTGKLSENLYVYRPLDNTLHAFPVPSQMPVGFGASMLADQHGHIYLTEGFLTPGSATAQAQVGWYRYDIASDLWHKLANLPQGLGYVQLAQDAKGNVLLLGGARDAGQHKQSTAIYRYNVSQDAWSVQAATEPVSTSGSASCAVGQDKLVIVGGYDAELNQSRNASWLLNLQNLQWQPLAPLPNGGSELGTAVCDGHGHVYVSRGANDPAAPTRDFLKLTLPGL